MKDEIAFAFILDPSAFPNNRMTRSRSIEIIGG